MQRVTLTPGYMAYHATTNLAQAPMLTVSDADLRNEATFNLHLLGSSCLLQGSPANVLLHSWSDPANLSLSPPPALGLEFLGFRGGGTVVSDVVDLDPSR